MDVMERWLNDAQCDISIRDLVDSVIAMRASADNDLEAWKPFMRIVATIPDGVLNLLATFPGAPMVLKNPTARDPQGVPEPIGYDGLSMPGTHSSNVPIVYQIVGPVNFLSITVRDVLT